jgi:hypothetical protein
MHTRKLALATLALTLFVAACGASASTSTTMSGSTASGSGSTSTATSTATSTSATATTVSATLAETHVDDNDLEWDAADEVAVTLSDGGSTGGAGVTVDGSTVTITAPGTYRISGTLSDGQLVVSSPDDGEVRLVLDDVSITNADGAAIAILDADKAIVSLADGSTNTLTDGSTYTFPSQDLTEPNAALYSAADLTIAGAGTLSVTGNYNDGIASKDGLVILGGTIAVNAVDDGIRGKDYLVVTDGTLTVNAGGAGLKSDNAEDATLGYVWVQGGTVAITSGADAINAVTTAAVSGGTVTAAAGDDGIHSDVRLEISGGDIDITRSYEGLEATQIVISGGDIAVVSDDDGLNVAGDATATGSTTNGTEATSATTADFRGGPGGGGDQAIEGFFVEMSGGTLVIDAGGDGFDSNGSASITGGVVVVHGPTGNGNGALDVNGEFIVSNAIIVAAGSAGMAEAPTSGEGNATLNIQFNSQQPAGTVVRIAAPDGSTVLTFQGSKAFQSLVVSSPALVAGTAYEIITGATASGTSTGGLYLDGGSSGGSSLGTITAG